MDGDVTSRPAVPACRDSSSGSVRSPFPRPADRAGGGGPADGAASLAHLVPHARRGDETAVAELLEHLRPVVFRYCLTRLGDRHFAEDVTQEVCLAVVTALPRYRDQGRPFTAYVFGIASNKLAASLRAARRRRDVVTEVLPEQPDGSAGPEDAALRDEAAGEMRALLATLPAAQREVLLLRVAGGLSGEEVAGVLGMSVGAVRVAQHRGLAALRGRVGVTARRE